MTGSDEGAKDTGSDKPAEAKAADAVPGTEAGSGTASAGSTSAGKASMLTPSTLFAAWPRRLPSVRIDPGMAAAATVALVVGTGFGLLAAPRGHSGEALVRIEAGLEAGRLEASRLNTEIEQLGRTLAAIRETGEAARGESRSSGASLTERLTRMEQSFERRLAGFEKPVPGEREAGMPLAATPAQPEKRAATPVAAAATTPAAASVTTARPEPTQTASIAEAKPTETRSAEAKSAEVKPRAETVENWALRDVYDGVAMLEDRRRRLVEVAPGDTVPGIGRVESIERRGRTWVVVTRQGLITPQMW